jgi:hypothetical protein
MKKTIYLLLCTLMLCGWTFGQTFRTHTTGTFSASITETGNVGHGSGGIGDGIVFGSNGDAMYRASIILSNPTTKAIGTFHANSGVQTSGEMVNVSPISAFTSSADHNQIAAASFNTTGAPTPNQIGVEVLQTSYSNTGDDFFTIKLTITNTTASVINDLYVGYFADWDVGGNNYTINQGGYIASKDLAYQYENGGAVDPSYYGIIALSGMSGARVTGQNPTTIAALRDSAHVWMSTFLNETISADDDYRSYIGSGPYSIGVDQSIIVGFSFVAGSDLADLEANSDNAIAAWNNVILPVELTSFAASVSNGQVVLNWSTATEINNMMFEVERKTTNGEFHRIGYVNGAGTTQDEQTYSYIDSKVDAGKYIYRLKQIDFSGEFEYSNQVEVEVIAPTQFGLSQNYPNPFNPSTQISYSIADAGIVKLSVYNLLGQQVALLVNEQQDAGKYNVSFDASQLSSGTYFYKLESGQQHEVKKMILTK